MKKLDVYGGYVGLLENIKELRDYLRSIDEGEILVNDWETTGLEYNATPLGLSLCARDKPPVFLHPQIFISLKEYLWKKSLLSVMKSILNLN